MHKIKSVVICIALMFFAQTGSTQVKNQPLTAQSFHGEILVNASPMQVWKVLTNTKNLLEIMGYEYRSGAQTMARPGDATNVKVWGDESRFTLIRANPASELRFNLDPANGSYICNCRWKLTKSANGTKVWFEERYTESAPQSSAELQAQVKETNEMLQRMKRKAEQK